LVQLQQAAAAEAAAESRQRGDESQVKLRISISNRQLQAATCMAWREKG
jgi:hypothetical protein